MNPVADGIDSSFRFIKGYQFDKKKLWKRNNIIFCVGLENMRIDGCDTVTNAGHPTPLMELAKFKKRYKKDDVIFIYKDITAAIVDVSY